MHVKLAVQSNGFTIKRDQAAAGLLELGFARLAGHFAPGGPCKPQLAFACRRTDHRRLLLV